MGQSVKVFFWVRMLALGPKDVPSAVPNLGSGAQFRWRGLHTPLMTSTWAGISLERVPRPRPVETHLSMPHPKVVTPASSRVGQTTPPCLGPRDNQLPHPCSLEQP